MTEIEVRLEPGRVADAIVELGELALAFGRQLRSTCHPDGTTRESGTDHTVMLGLVGCALARQYFPGLDVGLVAQYALVHDLPEAYVGDTCTLRTLSADAQADKERREQAASWRISEQFVASLPWVGNTLVDYEARLAPEARYIKALDKLMPKITQVLNGASTVRGAGMGAAELAKRHRDQVQSMKEYASDFPELFDVLDVLIGRILVMLDD
jgi:putative hydrolase of HD superfamily